MPMPRVTLNRPRQGHVSHRTRLRGRVFPVNSRVQVLVLSADGEWYLQQDATTQPNGRWALDAVFGCPERPESLHAFDVVAVHTEQKITARHLPAVPAVLASSRIVRVNRVK